MTRSPAVGFVLACVFLDALGIGLIIPVLPRLIGTLCETPAAQASWYGFIMLSYGLMQFFFAPVIGAISDRIGRRPVLLAGILGLALMMVVPAVTDSLWLILLSRVAGGIMSSNIVVAQAYIADVTEADRRTAAFGRIGAVFGIAFVLGPGLGGLLGEVSPRIPFAAAGVICALNFLYGLLVLPESLKEPSEIPFSLARANPFASLSSLSREPLVLPILLIITLYTLSQSLVQCTWALYTEFRYAWTPKAIGFSIFLLGASIAFTQSWLLTFLTKHFSPKHLITGGLCCGFFALLGISFSASGTPALVFLALFALMGIVGPTLQSIISRTGSRTTQGSRLGATSSLNSFTGAVSPLIGTPLLFSTTQNAPDSLAAGIPYLLCALLVAAALVLTSVFSIGETPKTTH